MRSASISQWLFVVAGIYAVLCIPAILLAEHYDLSETPLHVTQPIAVVFCAVAGLTFLWTSRGTQSRLRPLAAVAVVLAVAWLAFVAYVILTLDLGTD